ncbi:MAG: PKD domain-containing protein [Acidobacteriota bacterium]
MVRPCFRYRLALLTLLSILSFGATVPVQGSTIVIQQSANDPMSVSFSTTFPTTAESWSWDFGDGNGSVSPAPIHLYDRPGRYLVTVQVVVDGDLQSATAQVESGVRQHVVDFETWPPQDWTIDNVTASTDGAIVGLKGGFHDLTPPGLGAGCMSPDHNPSQPPPDVNDPVWGTYVYTGRLDLRSMRVADGATFKVFAAYDDGHTAPIFAVRIKVIGQEAHARVVVRDNGMVKHETGWVPIPDLDLGFEFQGWTGTSAVPGGGGARLRLLAGSDAKALATLTVDQVPSHLLSVDRVMFGVFDASIPAGRGMGVSRFGGASINPLNGVKVDEIVVLGYYSHGVLE